MARPPNPRRLLETRLGLRGLQRDPSRRFIVRRLGGQLYEHGCPSGGKSRRSGQGHRWAVGASIPARGHARTTNRLFARGDPLVGSLAQGPADRGGKRPGVSGVDAGKRAALAHPNPSPRQMGCRAELAQLARQERGLASGPKRRSDTRTSETRRNGQLAARLWIWHGILLSHVGRCAANARRSTR